MITHVESASTEGWAIRCACGDRLAGTALLSANGGRAYEPDTVVVKALPVNCPAVKHLNTCTAHKAIPVHERLTLRATVGVDN